MNETQTAVTGEGNAPREKVGTHTLTYWESLTLDAMEKDLTVGELAHIRAIYGNENDE